MMIEKNALPAAQARKRIEPPFPRGVPFLPRGAVPRRSSEVCPLVAQIFGWFR